MTASLNLFIVANFAQQEKKKESPLKRIYNHLTIFNNKSVIKYSDLIDFRNLGLALRASCSDQEVYSHLKNHPNTETCELQSENLLAEMCFEEKETFEEFITELETQFPMENKSRFNIIRDIKSEEFLCKEV